MAITHYLTISFAFFAFCSCDHLQQNAVENTSALNNNKEDIVTAVTTKKENFITQAKEEQATKQSIANAKQTINSIENEVIDSIDQAVNDFPYAKKSKRPGYVINPYNGKEEPTNNYESGTLVRSASNPTHKYYLP